MISDDLSNRRILILKSDQAPNILLSRLQKKCNKLIYVPIVKTLPNFRSSKVMQKFNRIDSYTLAIFISPNAVRYTFQFLEDQRMALPDHIEYFAVGLTSANLLSSRVNNVNYPKVNFSSEGLLELARFRDVINDRIIIFRGGEGSNLLRESLISQKAEVDYCCLLYTSPSPRDTDLSRMPSSA